MATGARSGRAEVTGPDGAPVEVDGTVDIGNLPDDVEILTLCDNQGGVPLVVVRFLRRDRKSVV